MGEWGHKHTSVSLATNQELLITSPQMKQEQQHVFDNFDLTGEHKPAPTVNRHVTGLVTPTDIMPQILECLTNVKENVIALRDNFSVARYVSEECLR